ncbi:Mucosaassociated lymphoid tissue lymphoma translocation protein 1like [Caligus rogercresseyi]|uniref:Mucosaassociated lymphoid tissue lymphoma translocation protein 1like n=1 Tax=Caligus rogercresseyi TaxID=217165 RepID=A0A7T8JUQ8_CALRO|nr:Mucosaassociated lymphoid tissue lymphoma translocation protein 1like [Caligus rogercresseyi]
MPFVYSCSRLGILFNSPLWKIKAERKEEWSEILRRASSIPERDILSRNDDIRTILQGLSHSSFRLESNGDVLDALADRSQKSFGWLTFLLLESLSASHAFIRFLYDLHEVYEPISILRESPAEEIEIALGSDTCISVEARGVPHVIYEWHFMRIDENVSLNKWEKLSLDPQCKELNITNLQLEDVGVYRCRLLHSTPVMGRNADGSINILEEPLDMEASLCGEVSFSVLAESTHPLLYEWYFEDGKVISNEEGGSKLILSNLRCEMSGVYKCKISNSFGSLESKSVNLVVNTPNLEELNNCLSTSGSEEITILKQPSFEVSQRVNVGELISLQIYASCKYPLKYEWCKRGLKQDLIETGSLNKSLPSFPSALTEVAGLEGFYPIGTWIYVCLISCPHTQEKLLSESVSIPMSTCTSGPKSLPGFKVALIICQEDYKGPHFHELEAPRYDGSALMRALKEMHFEVFSFINLSVEEIRFAVGLLCRFIDESTYVVFYYNGHALGSGTDIYLTGLDSSLKGCLEDFIWHGEIEILIDSCRPQLCVFIYDSCRSSGRVDTRPCPSSPASSSATARSPQCEALKPMSDLLAPARALYEVFMGQIHRTARVEEIFIGLSDGFMKGEDTTVVTKMRPEIKVSTKQAFYLSAPLRNNRFNPNSLFSFACVAMTLIDTQFKYVLGLAHRKAGGPLLWVTGKSSSTLPPLSYNIKILVKEVSFMNEALLEVIITRNDAHCPLLKMNAMKSSSRLLHAPIAVLFEPSHSIARGDGPVFPLGSSGATIKMVNLQKIRLHLWNGLGAQACNGVLDFPLPILKNFPHLKLP